MAEHIAEMSTDAKLFLRYVATVF